MRDEDKSKDQLIAELNELRKRINDPELLQRHSNEKMPPLYDKHGNAVGAIQSIRDITKRKLMKDELKKHRDSLENMINKRTAQLQIALAQLQQEIFEHNLAEQARRESENKFRLLFERSADAIILYNRRKHFDCNQAALEMFRCSDKKSLLTFNLAQLSPERQPDGRLSTEKMAEVVKVAYDKGTHRFEWVHRRLDGEVFYAQVTLTTVPIGAKEILYATCQDITARKQAEEMLRLSEQRFYNVFNYSPNPMAISSLDGCYVGINISFTLVLGYRREEVIGFTANDLNIFENNNVRANALRKLQDQGTLRNFEAYVRTKSGDLRFGLFSAEIIDIAGDKYLLTIFNDITERKQMEEELYKREQFLTSIFESIQDRLSIIDTDFNIIRTNKKVEQAHAQELPLIGKKCYKAYHGKDEICVDCPSLKTIGNSEPAHAIIPQDDPSGNEGWLDHYCYPLLNTATGQLSGVIVYARDITEKLRVEQEMARTERLHLVGQMAAGIGHEIRNPMTTVRGFLQLLEDKGEYAHHKEYFGLMISELDRANAIITEYLSLARNKPVNLVECDLNTILAVLQPLLMAEAMNAGIDLLIEQGNVPILPMDENEIRQLILNLVKNGLESMEHGGTLTVQTYADNSEMVLSVQDQGSGVRPDLLEKLGTPFLTTKDKGTGLGLAVCYGIAARHNAAITVDTGPAGTTFFVRFKLQT
ncbi:MAG: PAS domain S-box protein [Desulfotomaculaceae bacterium]